VTVSIRKPFEGEYVLTQGFGENPDVYAQFGKPGHNGLDYGLPNGTPVLAAADGTVLKTGYEEKGYGHYVIVQHDGFQTLYAHFGKIVTASGKPVQAGELIGYSDNSGFSTGHICILS
jgi:murein DD-endopeptidase MepM/ murein hydrolase activator NlpD